MPIYESLINLGMSLILVKFTGIAGVMLGTIISSVATCVWIEPHVLYKYGFEKSAKVYVRKYIEYMIVFLIALALSWGTVKGVELLCGGFGAIRSVKTIAIFAAQLIAVVGVSNGFLWIVYRNNENYRYLRTVVTKKVLKRK